MAVDLWLVDGSEKFGHDRELSRALVAIARHENSRDCLRLLASIVDNHRLIDHLLESFTQSVARPNAAFDVARKSLELIGATNHRGTEDTEKTEERREKTEDRRPKKEGQEAK